MGENMKKKQTRRQQTKMCSPSLVDQKKKKRERERDPKLEMANGWLIRTHLGTRNSYLGKKKKKKIRSTWKINLDTF